MQTNQETGEITKPIQPISELEFYKSAANLFESALKTISMTHGGHKCNKIANKALSIYYGGMAAMTRRGGQVIQDTSIVEQSTEEIPVNPYANGAFMGLG